MNDEKTIREAYHGMKGSNSAEKAKAYAANPKHQLRLVFWETTVGCNLECIHCRRLEVSRELAKEDLTTTGAFRFLDSLAAFAKPILVLSGGEPLFRPDIFEIAQYARARGLTVALATNGTLVTKRIAQQIKEAGIQRVSVSLDGATPEVHDEFRKLTGSFEAALRGLAHIKESGVETQVNCTIARHNVQQVEQIYNLTVDIGAKALHIFMLVPVGCGVEIAEDMMLPPEQYEEVLNWLYDKSREKRIETKATCAPHYFRILRERAREEGLEVTPQTHGMAAMTKGCLAGSAVCFVSHKGEVFPCGYLPVTCGNVKTQTFKEIWDSSPVFHSLRDFHNLTGKCGACEYRNVCMGCRARAFYASGDYMTEEPYCVYQPKHFLTPADVPGG